MKLHKSKIFFWAVSKKWLQRIFKKQNYRFSKNKICIVRKLFWVLKHFLGYPKHVGTYVLHKMLTYTPGIFMSIEDMKYNVDDPKWCAITYFLLRNFCSASAIIFLLFANDFIERHDLICFVFARSMKRSSLTCCDERISILSENSHCSNLGGRLFRLNSHTVLQ